MMQRPRRIVNCGILLVASVLLSADALLNDSRDVPLIATATLPADATDKDDPIVLHLTCFGPSKSASGFQERGMALECCRELLPLKEEVCAILYTGSSIHTGSLCREDFFTSSCEASAAQIPLSFIPSNGLGEDSEQNPFLSSNWSPIYSFAHTLDFHAESSDYESLRTTIGNDSPGWGQYKYILDENSNRRLHYYNVASPLSLGPEPMNGAQRSFKGSVLSELSSVGGMHRTLEHTITLSLPNEIAGTKSLFHGYLIVYAFIPEGIFMDVDDAFDDECRSSSVSCRAELITAPQSVIDIEQPAFVSPQHIVAINITFDGDQLLPSIATLIVGTKVHLRYPKLIQTNGTHVPVNILAPLLFSGAFTTAEQQLVLDSSCLFVQPITVQVAAGFEDDYIWVTLITMCCSIIGSLVMLRDISRISNWN